MFGIKGRKAKQTNGAIVMGDLESPREAALREANATLHQRIALLDRVNTSFAVENLRKTAELRKVNRAIAVRNRTIERLRKQLAGEVPPLPDFARTKEGKAIYSHAYSMGRRRGRKDIADAIELSASEAAALAANAKKDAGYPASGVPTDGSAIGGVIEQPATEVADYGREHAH